MDERNKNDIQVIQSHILAKLDNCILNLIPGAIEIQRLVEQAINISTDYYLKNQLEIVQEELVRVSSREKSKYDSQQPIINKPQQRMVQNVVQKAENMTVSSLDTKQPAKPDNLEEKLIITLSDQAREIESLRSQINNLQQQNTTLAKTETDQMNRINEYSNDNEKLRQQLKQLKKQCDDKETTIQNLAKDAQSLNQLQETIVLKNDKLNQMQQEFEYLQQDYMEIAKQSSSQRKIIAEQQEKIELLQKQIQQEQNHFKIEQNSLQAQLINTAQQPQQQIPAQKIQVIDKSRQIDLDLFTFNSEDLEKKQKQKAQEPRKSPSINQDIRMIRELNSSNKDEIANLAKSEIVEQITPQINDTQKQTIINQKDQILQQQIQQQNEVEQQNEYNENDAIEFNSDQFQNTLERIKQLDSDSFIDVVQRLTQEFEENKNSILFLQKNASKNLLEYIQIQPEIYQKIKNQAKDAIQTLFNDGFEYICQQFELPYQQTEQFTFAVKSYFLMHQFNLFDKFTQIIRQLQLEVEDYGTVDLFNTKVTGFEAEVWFQFMTWLGDIYTLW
ncbi:Conserved_hypothetical protein [Hexamita inflata]|uniref:Uncharacterized protein n=1 Tax=Hexamita inflata TaxID=28002 RepID=A0AA86RRE4_9EUKA|nr:Conserved hypothetical protein [Hexamita inflata]